MRRWLRIGGLVIALAAVLAFVVAVVFNLEAVQLGLVRQVFQSVRETTGWSLDCEGAEIDLWPGRIRLEGLTADGGSGVVARLREVEARWTWGELLGDRPRVEGITIIGPALAPDRLPPASEPDEAPAESPALDAVLASFEIGRLEVSEASASGAAAEVRWQVEGLSLAARLEGGRYDLDLELGRARVSRQDRDLAVGPVALALEGDADVVRVTRLAAAGDGFELVLDASAGIADGTFEVLLERLGLEPRPLIAWWDPSLLDQLPTSGALDLAGELRRSADGVLAYHLEHRGPPLVVAGIDLDRLVVDGTGPAARATVAGAGWGRLEASTDDGRAVDVALVLERTQLADLAAIEGVPAMPAGVPPDLELNGALRSRVELPFDLDQLVVDADLAARWSEGRVEVVAAGDRGTVDVTRLVAEVPGAELEASGLVSLARLALDLRLDVRRPDLAQAFAARWVPAAAAASVGGGPLGLVATVKGSMIQPIFDVDLSWREPEAVGRTLEMLRARVDGDSRAAEWAVEAGLGAAGTLTATGRTDFRTLASSGRYDLTSSRLEGLLALAEVVPPVAVDGAVTVAGELGLEGEHWWATATLELADVAAGEWRLDRLEAEVAVDPSAVVVSRLEAGLVGATVDGHGRVSLDEGGDIEARVTVADLSLAALPVEVPRLAHGTAAAEASVGGTLAEPEGSVRLSWSTADPAAPMTAISLRAALAGGILELVSEELRTAAGDLTLHASLPLGDVGRPAWFWPDAPGGVAAADLTSGRLSSAPLLAAAGVVDGPQVEVESLDGRVRWDLEDQTRRLVELEIAGLSLETDLENLSADDVVRVGLRDGRVVMDPVAVHGPRSRLELAGSYDLESGEIEARAAGTLDASVARILPVPLDVDRAIGIEIDLQGPPATLAGDIRLDHRGGTMLLSDPLVEMRDLELELVLAEGVVGVQKGQVRLNRGLVHIGGGWDPGVGQGIVLELTDVSFLLPMGILSRWDGVIAVEPHPGALARVAGELTLDGGFWDQPFEYTSLLIGGDEAGLASDDPLYDILLDLDVEGRRGLSVENNLGRFRVEWKRLHVGGSGALPALQGELTIPRGGVVNLAGKVVEVRRGSVEFLGDPFSPPRVEIIPEGQIASFGSEGEGGGIDTTAMATKTLARSLGSALGFENETLEPAEIAIQTETDPGQRFAVGQRLSRNLALFLTTNLADVQDRQTLLQLWNIPGLRGLAVQVFEETAADATGGAVIERLEWGGSRADEGEPLIHKVKLAGDWPLWKWRLRRSTRLATGRPYDPFLLFAGEVNLQRALAEAGYHEAKVSSRAEGSDRLPTLVFECAPGDRIEVRFLGDRLPRKLRRQVTGMFRPGPLEEQTLANMRLAVERHLTVDGYPEAVVDVERRDDGVDVTVDRGAKRRFSGPVVTGVPRDVAAALTQILSSPVELAAMSEDPERALRSVTSHLRSHGYSRVEAVDVRVDAGDDETATVHIAVDPGPRAVIDEIRIDGQDPLAAFVDHGAVFAPGQPVDRWVMDRALLTIRRLYRSRGYVDATASATVSEVGEGLYAVALSIHPGVQRKVAGVSFEGLRHLRETTLASGLSLVEGDIFDQDAVDENAAEIATFAPVKHVEARLERRGADGTEIVFDVAEKNRWLVGMGVRYRTDRGFEVITDLADRNLFGRGFGLGLRGRWDRDSLWGRLLFSFPQRPGRRSLWSTSVTYDEHDVLSDSGASLNLREEISQLSLDYAFALTPSRELRAFTRFRRTHIFDIIPDDFFPTDDLYEVVTVGGGFINDELDNPFDPRSGHYYAIDLSGNQDINNTENKSVRLVLTGSLVLEPRSGWTWTQVLRLGVADPLGGTLGPDERFKAGGQSSIRGFTTDFVGPVEELGGEYYAVGGGALFVLNQELRVPIWNDLRLAVFTDLGQVWEDWSAADWRMAVGAGIGFRYSTPIGPLWGDVAWPVANEGVSSGAKYYIGIGRTF